MDATPNPVNDTLKSTLHACARYAQIVLGLNVGDRDLLADPKLYGRCSRGIDRLLERALPAGCLEDGRALLVVGTRALVVYDGRVMTIMAAPAHAKRFGKRLLRDPDLVAAA
jgi:hypothetical protein